MEWKRLSFFYGKQILFMLCYIAPVASFSLRMVLFSFQKTTGLSTSQEFSIISDSKSWEQFFFRIDELDFKSLAHEQLFQTIWERLAEPFNFLGQLTLHFTLLGQKSWGISFETLMINFYWSTLYVFSY